MPEKKLNCNVEVLKKLQKDGTEVRVIRNKKGVKVKINAAHVTGCRIYQDPATEVKKMLYSVTTIDGRHHRGSMPKE